ncbi:MAG: ABC transporter permease [Pirellulaceae bacterium]|nr:ABC transporter permease [Pirellulaceae bacterium]
MHSSGDRYRRWLGTLAVFVTFVLLWQGLVTWLQTPQMILPPPTSVLAAAVREQQTLLIGFGITAAAALAALATSILLGVGLAILLSLSGWLRMTMYPYVIFLQTVPIVAIAPLLITWFGYGLQTIVLVATIISLFPIVSNVTAGLISVDRNLHELFQLCGASRCQTLWKLQIPFAVRSLILGARISAGLAVIGAIVGEFFVGESSTASPGLGTLIASWQRTLRTDAMIAAIITSTLLGLFVLGCVNTTSRLALRRWTEGQFEHH